MDTIRYQIEVQVTNRAVALHWARGLASAWRLHRFKDVRLTGQALESSGQPREMTPDEWAAVQGPTEPESSP